jgi:hypothetical protein
MAGTAADLAGAQMCQNGRRQAGVTPGASASLTLTGEVIDNSGHTAGIADLRRHGIGSAGKDACHKSTRCRGAAAARGVARRSHKGGALAECCDARDGRRTARTLSVFCTVSPNSRQQAPFSRRVPRPPRLLLAAVTARLAASGPARLRTAPCVLRRRSASRACQRWRFCQTRCRSRPGRRRGRGAPPPARRSRAASRASGARSCRCCAADGASSQRAPRCSTCTPLQGRCARRLRDWHTACGAAAGAAFVGACSTMRDAMRVLMRWHGRVRSRRSCSDAAAWLRVADGVPHAPSRAAVARRWLCAPSGERCAERLLYSTAQRLQRLTLTRRRSWASHTLR